MEHVKELLSEYIDGALAEAARRKVDSHLFTCAECRLELEELKAVAKMVGELRSKPLPAGFMDRLQKRRDKEARSSVVPSWFAYAKQSQWMRPASVVVCAMIVMVVAFDRMNRVFSPTARILSQTAAPASAPVQAQDEFSTFRNETTHQMKDSDARAFADAKLPAASHPTPPKSLAEEQASLRTQAAARPASSRTAGQLKFARDMGGGGAASSPPAMVADEPVAMPAASPSAARALENENLLEARAKRTVAATRGARKDRASDKGMAQNAFAPVTDEAGKNFAGVLSMGAKAKDESPKTREKLPLRQNVAAKKAVGPADARAIRTSEDLRDAWANLGGTGTPPVVDFNSEMLLAIRGPAEIIEIRPERNRILVTYRAIPKSAAETDSEAGGIVYRIVTASQLPVVFQKLP